MPKCLTHKQVEENFIKDLQELCQKHNITIASEYDIKVDIEPVYNNETNLYESYGATFTLNPQKLNTRKKQKQEYLTDTKNFPKHTR